MTLTGRTTKLIYAGILVRTLDKYEQEHPEWHENMTFPDYATAIPDIQRRISIGANKVFIEVVYKMGDATRELSVPRDIMIEWKVAYEKYQQSSDKFDFDWFIRICERLYNRLPMRLLLE